MRYRARRLFILISEKRGLCDAGTFAEVHDGEIWGGSVIEAVSGRCCGMYGGVFVYQMECVLSDGALIADLCLLPDVFPEYSQNVCPEPEVSEPSL